MRFRWYFLSFHLVVTIRDIFNTATSYAMMISYYKASVAGIKYFAVVT